MTDNKDEQVMVKEGVVRVGKTPSAVSGKPSTEVRNKEAYVKGEKDVDSIEGLSKEFDKHRG